MRFLSALSATTPERDIPDPIPAQSPRKAAALPLLGVLAALGAALAATVFAVPYANPDSHAFEAIARSLAAGRGFHMQEPLLPGLDLYAFRSPGYPMFLAALLPWAGVPGVLAVQGILVVLTAWRLGPLAAELGVPRARLPLTLAALVWPGSWWLAGEMMSEVVYTALLVHAVWFAVRAARGSTRDAVLAGVCSAMACWTRNSGVLLFALLPLWLVVRGQRRLAGVLLAVAVLTWSPWPIRNALHFRAFVPLTTNAGVNLDAGLRDTPVEQSWHFMAVQRVADERALDRLMVARASSEVRENPIHVLRVLAHRARCWLLPLHRDHSVLWFTPVVLLALVALFDARHRAALMLPGWLWLAHGAFQLPVSVVGRYQYTSEWVLLLAAAFGLVRVLERFGALTPAVRVRPAG